MARNGAPSSAATSTPLDFEPYNDPKNPKILTFYPTMVQFKDFEKYILYMETRNAHLGGIAKIVPPKEWKPRKSGSYTDVDDIVISGPIQQDVRQTSNRGAYDVRNQEVESMTVRELRRHALDKNLVYSFAEEMDEIERNFWKQLSINPPIYGADSSGTLFDEDCTVWNIAKLDSKLNAIGMAVPGVNTPYLYFGMWRAFFGWHTEDLDLYSINYIHDGAAKFWYAVAPKDGRRFERLAASLFPANYKQCNSFLRHKSTLISHSVIRSSGIPFDRIMQHEGEIIITFPYAYHAGFNCGLNVAESTNFATERWIEYGKYAAHCKCEPDNVKIDMSIFVEKYQPDLLASWLDGTLRGSHPEDERTTTKRPPTSGPWSDLKKSAALALTAGRMGIMKTSPTKTRSTSPKKKTAVSPDHGPSTVRPMKRASSDLSEPDSNRQKSSKKKPSSSGKRSCGGLKKDLVPCPTSYKPLLPGTPIMTVGPKVFKKEPIDSSSSSTISSSMFPVKTADRLSNLLRQRFGSSSSASSTTSSPTPYRQPTSPFEHVSSPSFLESPSSSSGFCMSISERVSLGLSRRRSPVKAESRNSVEAVPKAKAEPIVEAVPQHKKNRSVGVVPRQLVSVPISLLCDEGPVDLSMPRSMSPPLSRSRHSSPPPIFSNDWFQMYHNIRRQAGSASTSSSSGSPPSTDPRRYSHKGKKERPHGAINGVHII
ncbi:hypothetical protein RvY_14163 [Ramazzottius varieornatus]|uniref:JmjC domain-containing protein n=1 Tax=Ramazzottius varieornatus TaxID=947166 RepID=A0A1D1VU81_RAMVA|nr:hypothetical protein RvY_14163 [Ramazzottius varieornatus]